MDTGRKVSGGKYHASRKRKKFEIQKQPNIVKLGKVKSKKSRGLGGNVKSILLTSDIANIIDKKTKKSSKVKIKNVLETPSNRFWARQNILVKGSIVETEKGKARITNRPGREGSVQAVLVE